jgi:hypothetical protein
MRYLVKRTYSYTTEEWVTADSEREAKNIPPSDESRNYDDHWTESEILHSQPD